MPRILVVEDEAPLREALAAYLRREGLTVDEAPDGEAGWRLFRTFPPDLVLLDRKLPGLSGEELCRRIKGVSAVPVFMATSLVQEEAALEAFALGADDYVRKPYSVRELTARVLVRLRALPGNRAGASPKPLEDAALGLILDQQTQTAHLAETPLTLTPHEFDLLTHFLSHPGQVFSRQDLLNRIWSQAPGISDRTVDAHIKNLRAKLKSTRGGQMPLHTVYGRGYRWSL